MDNFKWTVITVDFANIFPRPCDDQDYYNWRPWDEVNVLYSRKQIEEGKFYDLGVHSFFLSFLKVLLVLLLSLQSNPIHGKAFLYTFLPVQLFLSCVTAEDRESVCSGELHHDRETKASDLLSQRTRLRPRV